MKYLVWIGGICDIETTDISLAQRIAEEWLDKGYEDVTIESEIV